jgi:hypothetical protein
LARRHEGKRLLKDLGGNGNIKMVLQEDGYGGMDWINLAENRNTWRALESALMKLLAP